MCEEHGIALVITLLEVSITVTPSILLAIHKHLQTAHPIPSRTTKLQLLHRIVHQHPHKPLLAALHPLRNKPARERHHPRQHPRPTRRELRWIQRLWLSEQAECRVYRDHFVVVGKVGVDGAVERKGDRRGVECPVRLGVVAYG